MLTKIKGNRCVFTIEILCKKPCCENPPCPPLTIGKQIPQPFQTLLFMTADPNCMFRYRIEFEQSTKEGNFYFEKFAKQSYSSGYAEWVYNGGWPEPWEEV